MEDIVLLQAIERYLDGTMQPAEKAYFEELRKNTPEIDQMVVEHNMFLHQIETYANTLNLKHTLNEIHSKLLSFGEINEGGEVSAKGKVVRMWNKYRKVTAIAACVGGAIALMISGLFAYLSPVNNNQIQQLKRDVEFVKRKQQDQGSKLNEVASKIPKGAVVTGGGSGFLIDGKGYIITNAHVLDGSSFANVINSNGVEFKAVIAFKDEHKDLAILKIEDADFKTIKTLPYSIKKSGADLGEEIFTLGYPRNDLTFNQGFLSTQSGFNGDSSSYQLQISANPGNSGGPVFNSKGEVIGILSTREKQAEGVAFAIKSKNIYKLVEQLKNTVSDTLFQHIKLPTASLVKGMNRKEQIKKMSDYIFLVQAFNKK
ncbi:MAG: trypsin-like peptidase domain-containing protein [Bacteroidetes bacterium]|nr:trypsin-like peptidase domain-containing protein [Bacteroidota bacterium]MBS1649878.1 trypsin-like peptidase domain-containing protein [Bacteroidota bacterium]